MLNNNNNNNYRLLICGLTKGEEISVSARTFLPIQSPLQWIPRDYFCNSKSAGLWS